jgi:hypothetical protein
MASASSPSASACPTRGSANAGRNLRSAQPLPGPQAQVEELGDAAELVIEEPVVVRAERDGLRKPGVRLDENELARLPQPAKRRVGRQLHEIGGIVGPQLRLVCREGPRHRLYLAKDGPPCGAHDLVDPARKRHGPAPARDQARHRDLEVGVCVVRERLGAELAVPEGAELGPPEPASGARGPLRADREVGQVADAHFGAALVEVEPHGITISVSPR